MLTLYRRLLALRRAEPALAEGSFRALRAGDGVFAYLREHDGRRVLVALNLTGEEREVEVADAEVALGTHADREGSRVGGTLRLRPDEAVVARVSR